MRALSNRFSMRLVLVALLACCILFPIAAGAQNGAWPIAVLEPPGANVARPILADVAFSADTAVLAYAGTPTQGYRIHLTTRGTNGWQPSQLLVEGNAADGEIVAVDSDEHRIAVGLPGALGGGRIDIHRRTGGTWTLEQSIVPPLGVTSFGRSLSIRGDLLAVSAVSSFGGGGLESYRLDPSSGQWSPASFSVSGSAPSSEYFTHTDGERIAACIEVACTTFVNDGNGTWSTEASVTGGRTPVAVSGEWLFVGAIGGGLDIHRRTGADWQLSQTLPGVGPFAISGSVLVVRNASNGRIAQLTVDGSGNWSETAHLDVSAEAVPSGAIAWNGTFALIGNQSLSPTTGSWLATGTVGLPDLSNARFGASLGVTRSRLWIGSPGLSVTDRAAGGIWVHALRGASLPSAGPVTPASPALSRGFGIATSVDMSGNLAIASRTQTMVAPHEARVALYSGSTPSPLPPQNDYLMPAVQGRILDIDVAYDVDAFALTWRLLSSGGQRPHSELLVYSNRGNGFVPTQTIELPDKGDWPDYGYGKRIVVYYDRIVAGVMRYERENVNWDYEPGPRLPIPLAWTPRASGIAANDTWVVLPYGAEFGVVAQAYAWRAGGQGYEQVGVYNNGFPITDGCKVMAIDANDTIACLTTSADGPAIYRATRANASSPWLVTAGGRVPGPAAGHASRFTLAMHGNEVYVGWPQTGPSPAGSDVGRVVGMTFDETILRTGFELP